MNIREHVDALFAEYKDTASMRDFKEELCGNLTDRIEALRKKGLNEADSLEKAIVELGDVSVIADELSMKKKQEVFSDIYMGTRKYLTPGRTALFIVGGIAIAFGLLFAAVTWFATELQVAALGAGMLFIVIGGGFMTFMGMTQETAAKKPLSWKRASLYAISVAVFMAGVFSAPLVYFATTGVSPAELAAGGWMLSPDNLGFTAAISVLIPFVLPGAALFVFLILTEKDRSKPWVAALREQAMQYEHERFANAKAAERFGIFSGALWIAGMALFVLLTITVGIKFSWLALVAALVGEMLLLAGTSKKND
jgi:MFS family permease